MSRLTDAQRSYRAALERASTRRAVFVEELRAQRARGRTLDDIGTEVGLSRSRVLRLLEERSERSERSERAPAQPKGSPMA